MKGTRNNAAWRGYPKGKALLLGARSGGARINNSFIRGTMQFAVDEFYHLRQRPKSLSGTIVLRGQDELPSDNFPAGTAKHVSWYQPFPFTSDFALLGVG